VKSRAARFYPVMEAPDLGDRDDATPGRRLEIPGNGGIAF